MFENQLNNNLHYIIGISDPNLNKEKAIEQATLRAKALYALLLNSKVSNITDDYTNLIEENRHSLYSTKFQDFTLSKSKFIYNHSCFNVKDTFYTKYKEGIVLLEYKDDSLYDKKDTLEVKAEHLQIFIERNFKTEKVEFYNLHITENLFLDSTVNISQYNYKKVNRNYDIASIYNNDIIEFIEGTYNYRCEIEFMKDSLDSELHYFRLSHGIWNSHIAGLISNITFLSKYLATQVKNSNDFYTLRNQGLIRTVSRNNVTFYIDDYNLLNNNLFILLNGKIIHKK